MSVNPTDAKNLRWHVDERKCDGRTLIKNFLHSKRN